MKKLSIHQIINIFYCVFFLNSCITNKYNYEKKLIINSEDTYIQDNEIIIKKNNNYYLGALKSNPSVLYIIYINKYDKNYSVCKVFIPENLKNIDFQLFINANYLLNNYCLKIEIVYIENSSISLSLVNINDLSFNGIYNIYNLNNLLDINSYNPHININCNN